MQLLYKQASNIKAGQHNLSTQSVYKDVCGM
jgi:hypothetical protein